MFFLSLFNLINMKFLTNLQVANRPPLGELALTNGFNIKKYLTRRKKLCSAPGGPRCEAREI